jgi:hypothetical protein
LRKEYNIDIIPMPLSPSTVLMGGEKYALYLFQNGNRIIQDTKKVCFVTYEEALLNGILYTIENVI